MTRLRVASASLAAAGEQVCGDRVACLDVPGQAGHWLLVVDGLGHGPAAAHAADLVLALVADAAARGLDAGDPLALMQRIDAALADSRGAAVGLAWLGDGELRHAGVGNTRVLRWRDGQALRLPSRYGIVGEGRLQPGAGPSHGAGGAIAVQRVDLQPGDWLLLFSDGLDERLHLAALLPAWQADPSLMCAHLMERWRQPRDDAAVLACQILA